MIKIIAVGAGQLGVGIDAEPTLDICRGVDRSVVVGCNAGRESVSRVLEMESNEIGSFINTSPKNKKPACKEFICFNTAYKYYIINL